MKHKPWEVEDGRWERIEPLLPVVKRRYRYPGRKRLERRRAMCGILFELYTGIRREFLPQELAFDSGMTCRRRLRDWKEAGVWQQLRELLLAELRAGDALDHIVDVHGIPLAVTVTGGNRNDVTQLLPQIHAVPPIRGQRGRLRQRPDVRCADRG